MLRASLALTLLLSLVGCREEGVAQTGGTSSGGGEGGESGEGGGTTTSGSGAGTPMVVVTWNVRNFFDTDQDSTDEGELIPSQAEYEQKIEDIAAVLRDLNGDVVVLQEVENQEILVDLANRVSLDYVDIRLVEGNDFRGIDVGAFAKVPFDSVVSHKDDSFSLPGGAPKTFTRDCPEFHLTFAARRFVFLGVHFRSKGGDDDPDRRLAEAFRSRQIADEVGAADPEAGVVILGDYNDLPGSDPVELIRTGPPAFVDAVDSVPEGDRWTFNYMGTEELIDHMMANPVMAPMLDPASVAIRHDSAQLDASDHSPVVATYMVR